MDKVRRTAVDHQAQWTPTSWLVLPLQRGAMQCLGIHDHLTTTVVNNQHPDGSPAGIESLLEAVIEVGLVKHRQGLLHITGLGHGHNFRYTVSLQIRSTVKGRGALRTYRFRPGGQGLGIASGWVRAWSGQRRSGRGCEWTRTPRGAAW